MAEIPPPLLRAPPSEGETHTHGEGGAFCHGLPSVLHKHKTAGTIEVAGARRAPRRVVFSQITIFREWVPFVHMSL